MIAAAAPVAACRETGATASPAPSHRATIFGAVASTGACGLPAIADAGIPVPDPDEALPAGPLTLTQAEATDFAALWASLSPEAQARIGALAIKAEAFDQVAQDGGFHTTAEDRERADSLRDAAQDALRSAIWAALPTVMPTVHDEPYPLWQIRHGRSDVSAEVDVHGLGRRPLVEGEWQWFARDGGQLVELGGAVDLDSRDEAAAPRWQFWTVADIDAERLRRHPEMASAGGAP